MVFENGINGGEEEMVWGMHDLQVFNLFSFTHMHCPLPLNAYLQNPISPHLSIPHPFSQHSLSFH